MTLTVTVSDIFITRGLRTGAVHRAFRITKGLPDDARLVGAEVTDLGDLRLHFSSETVVELTPLSIIIQTE